MELDLEPMKEEPRYHSENRDINGKLRRQRIKNFKWIAV